MIRKFGNVTKLDNQPTGLDLGLGKGPDKTGSGTILTPSTVDQAIPQGWYGGVVADGKIKGDSNHIAGNIKQGITDFGVTGSYNPVRDPENYKSKLSTLTGTPIAITKTGIWIRDSSSNNIARKYDISSLALLSTVTVTSGYTIYHVTDSYVLAVNSVPNLAIFNLSGALLYSKSIASSAYFKIAGGKIFYTQANSQYVYVTNIDSNLTAVGTATNSYGDFPIDLISCPNGVITVASVGHYAYVDITATCYLSATSNNMLMNLGVFLDNYNNL